MHKKDTSWGNVADWYHDLLESSSDTYQSEVILPNLMRLVKPAPGLAVLDLACGQGYFSRAFAAGGAEVIGADLSAALIEHARAHSPASIEYHVASSDKIPFIKNGAVNAVTIILALQNIERYRETLIECARVLASGGRLYLVLNHPTFRVPKKSSWGFDEKADTQYRRVDEYLSESATDIVMNPGEEAKKGAGTAQKTVSFHRPMQAYFKALEKAGFAVSRLEEWTSHKTSQTGPRKSAEDKSRKEIPMFLMLEAKKV